jgi:hypothetical protein
MVLVRRENIRRTLERFPTLLEGELHLLDPRVRCAFGILLKAG